MIWEDPTMNWRRSYAEGLTIKLDDLRRERAAQSQRRIYINDRAYVVRNLTDSKLEEAARRENERDINRAIIQHDEAKHRRCQRRSEAF